MRGTQVQTPVNGGNIDISLRDLVAPLFRRKRLILTSCLGIFAGFMIIAMLRGPFYSSHMAILVNRERLDPLVSTQQTTPMVTANDPVTQEEINSEAELLRSSDVLETVVVANGLQKPRGFSLSHLLRPNQTEADRIERAVKQLAGDLKIKPILESNVIEATYGSRDPQLAYGVLKSLGDAYLAKHVAVHRPAGSYEFFATETQKYSAELHTAEDNLRRFEEQYSVADPNDQLSNLAQQVATSVGNLYQAEEWIAGDEQRIREDQLEMGRTPQRLVTKREAASNDKVIDDVKTALLGAETRRMQLALKYDDSYPLVKEADQEIAQDKAAVKQAEAKTYIDQTTDRDPTFEFLREDLAKTEADLAAQRATRVSAQRSVHSIQEQMVNLDQLAMSQRDLERTAKAAEGNYLLYLGKREQERASNAMDVTRIANVAIAMPPAIPVLPTHSWPFIVFIGFAIAAFLSIGVGYTADYFDPSFHTPAQVSNTLGIPVVIAMPKRAA
ncbi:MAG: Wzz/FepE/Etk N-terminal domain-containing protein [Acidobacteriaceae bacterium]